MMELQHDDVLAIVLSLKIAFFAMLVSLPFGFAAAWLLVFSRMRGRVLFEVIINLPLTLPPVVIGYLLLLFFGRHGWGGMLLGWLDMPVVFTWKAAVIASSVVGFPLLVRSIRIAMEAIDVRLIAVSRTLGASAVDTLVSVIVPLSFHGILAGSTLLFARSLGEFGATIIVAGNMPGLTQTIPLAIYDYAASPTGTVTALSLSVVSILISVVVLVVHEGLSHRIKERSMG